MLSAREKQEIDNERWISLAGKKLDIGTLILETA
jgi:hypothetical protein